jgi:hypothetical protein
VLSGSPEARQAAVAAAASAYADSLSPAQRSALSAEHARQDLAGHPAPQAFRPGVAVNTMLIIASVPITLGVALGAAFGWTRLGGRES